MSYANPFSQSFRVGVLTKGDQQSYIIGEGWNRLYIRMGSDLRFR